MENEVIIRMESKELHKLIFDAVLGAMKIVNESAYRVTVDDSEPILIRQAAEFINSTVRSVYHLTSQNRIPYHKKGGKLYFFRGELTEWIRQGKKKKEDTHE